MNDRSGDRPRQPTGDATVITSEVTMGSATKSTGSQPLPSTKIKNRAERVINRESSLKIFGGEVPVGQLTVRQRQSGERTADSADLFSILSGVNEKGEHGEESTLNSEQMLIANERIEKGTTENDTNGVEKNRIENDARQRMLLISRKFRNGQINFLVKEGKLSVGHAEDLRRNPRFMDSATFETVEAKVGTVEAKVVGGGTKVDTDSTVSDANIDKSNATDSNSRNPLDKSSGFHAKRLKLDRDEHTAEGEKAEAKLEDNAHAKPEDNTRAKPEDNTHHHANNTYAKPEEIQKPAEKLNPKVLPAVPQKLTKSQKKQIRLHQDAERKKQKFRIEGEKTVKTLVNEVIALEKPFDCRLDVPNYENSVARKFPEEITCGDWFCALPERMFGVEKTETMTKVEKSVPARMFGVEKTMTKVEKVTVEKSVVEKSNSVSGKEFNSEIVGEKVTAEKGRQGTSGAGTPGFEPTIRFCHQLDNATSGILLMGLTKNASARVSNCFQQRDVEKVYHCIVEGWVDVEAVVSDLSRGIGEDAVVSDVSDVSRGIDHDDGGVDSVDYDTANHGRSNSVTIDLPIGDVSEKSFARRVYAKQNSNNTGNSNNTPGAPVSDVPLPPVPKKSNLNTQEAKTTVTVLKRGWYDPFGGSSDNTDDSTTNASTSNRNGAVGGASSSSKFNSSSSNSNTANTIRSSSNTRSSGGGSSDISTNYNTPNNYTSNPIASDMSDNATTNLNPDHQFKSYPQKRVSLLAVRIHTGRRHQIRVHLHHIGHPILGDAVYCEANRKRLETGEDVVQDYEMQKIKGEEKVEGRERVVGNESRGTESRRNESDIVMPLRGETVTGIRGWGSAGGPGDSETRKPSASHLQTRRDFDREQNVFRMFLHSHFLRFPTYGVSFRSESGFEKFVREER